MRTNIEIDDKLMKQAMKASRLGVKTKKAVVEEALQMMVNSRLREGLRDLRGKVQFWDDYDYKAMRLDEHATEFPASSVKTPVRRMQGKRSARSSAA